MIRIPLGLLFLLVAERMDLALAVLVVAGLTDVLDGWTARRGRSAGDGERHRGDWLDPLCDKIFVGSVMVGIYLAHGPPVILLVLTVTREILQVISLAAYKIVPGLRRSLANYPYRAHALGKATTVCQFFTSAALLFALPVAVPLAVISSLLGLMTVGLYFSRARALARPAP